MNKLLRKLTAAVSAAAVAIAGVNFGGIGGVTARAETQGAFEVTGTGDYSYSGGVLTIKDGAEVTIKNTDPSTPTTDRIAVEAGANVNITLDGVYIDGSGETSDFCAFKIADDSTGNVTITLADGSENTLISNQRCAGLQKNGSGSNIGTLTIKGGEEGTGKLIATSGKYGAGIGGGGSYGEEGYDSSNITISGGTVIASGSKFGAGIGGGASWDCAGGNGEDITISGGTVTATSWNGAGIGGGCSWNSTGGSGENINISGGTVTAKCEGKYGAGIGGGMHGSCSDVTISGGVVMATGSSGAGIGGGYNGNCSGVTISGGTVTTSSNIGPGIGGYSTLGETITVSDIKITGGSVKAVPSEGNYPIGDGYKTAVTPTNGNGENVSLYKVDNAENYNVKVNGETYTPVNHKAADDNDTDLYLYLTESAKNVEVDVNGTWLKIPFVTPPEPVANLLYSGIPQALVSQGSTTVGTLKYSLEKNGAYSTEIPKGTDAGTYTVWYMVESGEGHIGTSPKCVEVVISDELLSITAADGSELVKGEDYTYENKVLKVCTEKEVIISNIISDSANDHQIVIASCVYANVTLSNVKIDVSAKSDTAAFLIEDGGTGTVCVTLADGTTNTLKSGYGCAGLQKNDDNVALVIDGNGTLNATGGIGGAGIGGGKNSNGANITINSGTVTAKAGNYDFVNRIWDGAGIGGGYMGNGTLITINGGNVTAKSDGSEGSGIGGGFKGSGSYITVNGGIVYAEGANGAGIGGGNEGSGSYIEIIGGTVTAYSYSTGAGIGGGNGGSGSNIKISGGTVKATAKNNGAGIGGGYGSSGTDITISGGVVTATSNDQGAGIGGGMDAEASNIVITGGSVNAYSKNANAIGGGLNKAAVTPTLADMITPVYLLEIANANGADVSINGIKYPTHDDNKVYAYLPGDTNHTVRVGTSVTVYTYYENASVWIAVLELNAPAAVPGLVYDGTEQTLVSAGSAETGCTMSYSLTKDGTYTTALPTGKDAGTYEVWYKMTLGETVFAGPDCVEVEISRRPVKVTADDAEKIYTEADPMFEFTIDTDTQLINGDTLEGTLTRVKGESVGTYDITQGTLTNESNPNYDIIFTAGTFTIKKATPQVTAPTAVTGLVYTGTAQELITEGETDYGTLLYSLDGISYSTSIPTGTAADSYTVFYKVDGGANAEDVEEDAVLATIGKAAVTITADSHSIKVGDTLPTFDYKVSGLVNNETLPITVTISCTATDSTTAGTFPIRVSGADESTNYAFTYVNGTLTITAKKVQTITAEDVTFTYGETGKKIGATTNGDGAISYAVKTGDDVITVGADGAITALKAGTATVEITAAETEVYAAATKTVTVTVNKVAVTITANSYTIKVGEPLPTFEYKVTGLASNETLPITVTISCTATDSSTAGTFPITVSGAAESTNHAFTYVNGTLKITSKEIQTVTAEDVTFTYGETGKKITATTNGDGAISYAVTTGDDVISVDADGAITALKAGMSTVEITAAETDAYEQATATVTVTVNKAAVTIKANDKTVKQGAALPTFDYTVTGLVNGDKLSFTPVLTCAAADTSTVGTYAITITIEITEDECYTYTAQNGTLTVQKKSSGGGGGGGGGYRPTTPTEPNNPSIGGSSKSWSDIAADLSKLATGSEATIELNGNTTVPVEVIKVIDDRQLKVTFVVDSVKSWKADGAEITTPAAADLSILTTSKLKTDTLRGISGLQFTMNNTNIPTDLTVAFKTAHAGKFANLYKDVDGKLTFVTCAKLGEDGKVILPDVIEKGDYVAMLCEFSDRLGDMDNDGVMNAKDASAILKDIVGLETGKNPLMADFNGDGKMNAMDASAILKRIVGLA